MSHQRAILPVNDGRVLRVQLEQLALQKEEELVMAAEFAEALLHEKEEVNLHLSTIILQIILQMEQKEEAQREC